MTNFLISLVNWGMGTALIIIFAVVCIVLTIMVLNFAIKGKSKEEYMNEHEESQHELSEDEDELS